MASFTFRRLTRAEFQQLAGWLAEPHVARWWCHEFTAEAVERDFGRSVDGLEPGEDHLVLLDGQPIGLIQYSRYRDHPEYIEELAPLLDVPADAVSIDYLIGDPHLTGKGHGTAMIRAFVEQIWRPDQQAGAIIVPVCSANLASWKALLGAGFRVVARGELPPDNPIDDPLHEVLQLDRSSGDSY